MHEWDPIGPFMLLNLTLTSSTVTRLLAPGASFRCDRPLTKITKFKIITIIYSNFFLFCNIGN